MKHNYLLLLILIFSLPQLLFAGNKYEVSLKQEVRETNLYVSFYIQALEETGRSLGSTDFIIKVNEESLNLSKAKIIDSTRGVYSARVNSDLYDPLRIGARKNLINLAVFKKISGDKAKGVKISTRKTRIASVKIPITDFCAQSRLEWFPDISAYQDYKGNDIKSQVRFKNPDSAISLTTQPDMPILPKPSDSVSCENDPITLKTSGKGGFKWYLDGEFIKETNDPNFDASQTGSYTVKALRCNKESVFSEAVALKFKPLPQKPVIKEDAGMLVTNVSENVQWYLNDEKIDGATSSRLIPESSGYYKVGKANNCGTSFSDEKQLSIMDAQYAQRQFNLEVKPNPFVENCKIQFNLPAQSKVDISLWDLNGKKIAVLEKGDLPSGNHFVNIQDQNLNLASGKYLLKFKLNDKVITRNLVKQK